MGDTSYSIKSSLLCGGLSLDWKKLVSRPKKNYFWIFCGAEGLGGSSYRTNTLYQGWLSDFQAILHPVLNKTISLKAASSFYKETTLQIIIIKNRKKWRVSLWMYSGEEGVCRWPLSCRWAVGEHSVSMYRPAGVHFQVQKHRRETSLERWTGLIATDWIYKSLSLSLSLSFHILIFIQKMNYHTNVDIIQWGIEPGADRNLTRRRKRCEEKWNEGRRRAVWLGCIGAAEEPNLKPYSREVSSAHVGYGQWGSY